MRMYDVEYLYIYTRIWIYSHTHPYALTHSHSNTISLTPSHSPRLGSNEGSTDSLSRVVPQDAVFVVCELPLTLILAPC